MNCGPDKTVFLHCLLLTDFIPTSEFQYQEFFEQLFFVKVSSI